MAELLASLSDIQKWLPADKLKVGQGDTDEEQIEAYRLIRAQLSGVFPVVTLASWVSPSTTPDIINSIAGRLIAAYIYRKAYSEDIADVPQYAQTLYDEARDMLIEIRSGNIDVLDDDGNPISGDTSVMSSDDFYPNDSAPGPYFTMEQEWA